MKQKKNSCICWVSVYLLFCFKLSAFMYSQIQFFNLFAIFKPVHFSYLRIWTVEQGIIFQLGCFNRIMFHQFILVLYTFSQCQNQNLILAPFPPPPHSLCIYTCPTPSHTLAFFLPFLVKSVNDYFLWKQVFTLGIKSLYGHVKT